MRTDSVVVVCAEASHEGKVAKVALFLRNQGSVVRWHEESASTVKSRREAEDRPAGKVPGVLGTIGRMPRKDQPDSVQVIHGDRLVKGSKAEGVAASHLPDAHVKYALECPRCGLNVQTTEDRLLPILDRLGEAGVSRISLAALAARLA